MARVSDAELERLKTEVSVERLATARGVELRRHGADLLGLCPFHDDREPSLVISPAKNLWHCLGACQSGGSVIDWVMRAQGVSFRHAVELLRADAPFLVASSSATPASPDEAAGPARSLVKHSTVKKLSAPVERDADDEAALVQVVEYYERTLKESPEALEYLERRGLRHAQMVEHFRLGYANRTLGYRLPDKNRAAGAAVRGRLQRLGVLRESGHEHFNGSVVVPIFDEAGRVVEMYGRKVGTQLRASVAKHLYLPGPHRGVWNAAAVRVSKELVLCESLIDALTFWCAGYRHVTASYGVEGFTNEHLELFAASGTERVLIAYDRDEAGDRAADKLAKELAERGMEALRVIFPKGMDANEYALKVGPADQSLGLVLRQAEWLAGKRRAVASAGEQLSSEPEPTSVQAAAAATASEPAAPFPLLAAECETPLEPAIAAPTSKVGSTTTSSSKDELTAEYGPRRWRVRGLAKNTQAGVMRVNVLVSEPDGAFHVDTLELYSARQRGVFVKQAAEELGLEERIVKRDLGQLLLALEAAQEAAQAETDTPAKPKPMSEAEEREALELLRTPRLAERILADFERCGIVGERVNKLVGYLAATSRKLDAPLAIVIQSSSAAGKSSLMEAILALMPDEERMHYSAMTGQSLFYLGEQDLSHKILAVVEEEGAERASYALKLLQSEGELTIASTGKDPTTGRLITHDYRVEGPVMLFLTTTAIDVDEELLNRCLVLTVDEGRAQTRAIHELQRRARTLDGVVARKERQRTLKLHQNAQRLLSPLCVVNPYAARLRFPDHLTRMRRDHQKYLGLIDAIALLHQYQRPVREAEHRGERVRYLEVTAADIELANELSDEVLGRSADELPPKTRELLCDLGSLVTARADAEGVERADVRFTQREVRERTRCGQTQLKVHLRRLVEMEYLVAHREGRSHRERYELAYERRSGDAERWVLGLLDAGELSKPERSAPEHAAPEHRPNAPKSAEIHGYDSSRSGSGASRSALGRPVVGPWSVCTSAPNGARRNANSASDAKTPECTSGGDEKRGSYPQDRVVGVGGAAAAAAAKSAG